MKKMILVGMSMLAFAILSGCVEDDAGSDGSVELSSKPQAKEMAVIAMDIIEGYKPTDEPVAAASAKITAANGFISHCSDGGTVEHSSGMTDDGNGYVIQTYYDQCRTVMPDWFTLVTGHHEQGVVDGYSGAQDRIVRQTNYQFEISYVKLSENGLYYFRQLNSELDARYMPDIGEPKPYRNNFVVELAASIQYEIQPDLNGVAGEYRIKTVDPVVYWNGLPESGTIEITGDLVTSIVFEQTGFSVGEWFFFYDDL